MKPRAVVWQLVLAALVVFCGLPAALAAIGSAVVVVNNVTGKVKEAPAGAALHVGTDVQQDETVETGNSSATQLVFSDNTQFEIGPTSQVILDRFVFDPNPSKSQVVLSLAKGAARFTTGILPKSDYEIRTPSASIGIRGTILQLVVSPLGATTVAVESGTAMVTGAGMTVVVNAGQSTVIFPAGVPSAPIATAGLPEADQIFRLLKEGTKLPTLTTIITTSNITQNSSCISPSKPDGGC